MDKYAKRQSKLFRNKKDCRWCGHKFSLTFYDSLKCGFQTHCISMKCLASGPIRKTKRSAIMAWNKRKR